jgi:hypothetical protein
MILLYFEVKLIMINNRSRFSFGANPHMIQLDE